MNILFQALALAFGVGLFVAMCWLVSKAKS